MVSEVMVGPLRLNAYGLILGVGMVVALEVAQRVARREGIDGKVAGRGFLAAVGLGVVGARVYHVIDWWDYYAVRGWDFVRVWDGGLGIWGGIAGGVVGLMVYGRLSRVGVSKLVDLAALVMPLGQAIGRWGNWVNQELYGLPTKLPWGIEIPREKRLEGFEMETSFHPLFAYESLADLVLFGWLIFCWWKGKYKVGRGKLTAAYLAGYGLIRFGLEGLRISPWSIGGVRMAQLIAGVAVIMGGGYLWRRRNETR